MPEVEGLPGQLPQRMQATAGGDIPEVTSVDASGNSIPAPTLATAANLRATGSTGAAMVTRPGDWSVQNQQGDGGKASISKAAGAAGVSHVCTSITATLGPQASGYVGPMLGQLILRDGASGSGTNLWQGILYIGTTAQNDSRIHISGLNIVGTAATAMTLGFEGSNFTKTNSTVAMTGYDTPSA